MVRFYFSWKLLVYVAISLAKLAISQSKMHDLQEQEKLVAARNSVISSVVWTLGEPPDVVMILVIDEMYQEIGSLVEELNAVPFIQGFAILELTGGSLNNSDSEELVEFAVGARRHFQNTRILILSDDVSVLWDFAEYTLRNRLVTRNSKMIVHGDLEQEEINMMTEHWIYSMMDGLLIIPVEEGIYESWELLSCQVFTTSGMELIRVGTWSQSEEILFDSGFDLFPQKFSNLHGATVNVSVLPYEPYWIEEELTEGNIIYSGTDRLMLEAMASTFNFSIGLESVQNWGEAHALVSNRSVWTVPTIHMVIPSRMELFDYTQTYEYGVALMFVMVKPVLEPKWQSLYYPLSDGVWLAILGALFVVSLGLFVVINAPGSDKRRGFFSYNFVAMEVFGMLLAQGSTGWHPPISSVRLLLAVWLLSGYIISTTYKGNLVASLVAPRYPPRPETLEELVKAAERATIPAWGQSFKDMILAAGTESLTTLGGMIDVGYDAEEGLNLALEYRYPYIDTMRVLQNSIALHYTEADGTSPFYIGREGLATSFSGWPIPHDAPFKANFDFVISALTESGIYNKWMSEWQSDAERRGRLSKRLERELQHQEDKKQIESETKTMSTKEEQMPSLLGEDEDEPKALTIVHFQGPLLLWAIGGTLATISFASEYLLFCYSFTGKMGMNLTS